MTRDHGKTGSSVLIGGDEMKGVLSRAFCEVLSVVKGMISSRNGCRGVLVDLIE